MLDFWVRRGTTILSGCTTKGTITLFTSPIPLPARAFGSALICSLRLFYLPRFQTTRLPFYRTTQSKLFSRTRLALHHNLEGHRHLPFMKTWLLLSYKCPFLSTFIRQFRARIVRKNQEFAGTPGNVSNTRSSVPHLADSSIKSFYLFIS